MLKQRKMIRTKLIVTLFLALALTLSMAAAAWAAVEDTGFADVNADAWYAEAVSFCRDNGLMNGNTETTFDPEDSLTRAMLVTVLYRFEGEPEVAGDDGFSDTADGQWYSNAVLWATQQGVVNGYGEGLFGPDDNITQEQLNLIMSRYAEQAVTENVNGFTGSTAAATRAQVAAVLMNLAVAANETTENQATKNETTETSDNDTTSNNEPKILVAYFSATNNTESIANHIATTLGADLYEIIPETPYTSADLNYGNSSSRTTLEMNDPASRPAIGSAAVENMADYDVVFLGYPIWWGQAPRIISTFLESYDFSGKTIVPFCTSASSGIGSSASNLHSLAEDANWLSGQRFSGGASQTEVANWVNSLNLTANR